VAFGYMRVMRVLRAARLMRARMRNRPAGADVDIRERRRRLARAGEADDVFTRGL
jgi:hypothetical protein